MKELEKYVKYGKYVIRVGIGIIVLPIIICLLLFLCTQVVSNNLSGFLGFFGSFYGGIIGGIATLVAVVLTIWHNKEEQEEIEEKEKEKIIQKSAIIVFYDFAFAFKDIFTFLTIYFYRRKSKSSSQDSSFDYGDYLQYIDVVTQFYFDKDWIKTVAELSGVVDSQHDDIEKIYEIYGHLMTINKSLSLRLDTNVSADGKQPLSDSNSFKDRSICYNAFDSMTKLFSPEIGVEGNVEITLNYDIYKLMDILRRLGNIKKGFKFPDPQKIISDYDKESARSQIINVQS